MEYLRNAGEVLLDVLAKMGTLLIDRRVFTMVATILVTLGILPWTLDDVAKIDQQLADTILAITLAVEMTLGLLGMFISFAIRPPSGRNYSYQRMDEAEIQRVATLKAHDMIQEALEKTPYVNPDAGVEAQS
jgi:hypothetical protein